MKSQLNRILTLHFVSKKNCDTSWTTNRKPNNRSIGKSAGVIISCIDPRNPDLGTHILANGARASVSADKIDIWHTARIAAGIPEGAIDLTPERALMLEAGLDQLGAVDFEKGCYVGQEVTARTHYRGLVKRRLVPITIKGEPPIVNSAITWNEKVIGNSKTAAPSDNGMSICLALLKLSDIHAILDGETITMETLRSMETPHRSPFQTG